MAGTGVRAAGALDEFREVVRLLGIPVTTAWTHDLIATDDPLFADGPAPSANARATLPFKIPTPCWFSVRA